MKKVRFTVLIATVAFFFAALAEAAIFPEIKLNGMDSIAIVNPDDPENNLTIKLDVAGESANNVDWWLLYESDEEGLMSLNCLTMKWEKGVKPMGQWNLKSQPITSIPTTGLNFPAVESGSAVFFFGIDLIANGQFDYRSTIYQYVVANCRRDCSIAKLEKFEDFGLTGNFGMTVRLESLPKGALFLSGQTMTYIPAAPNGPWDDASVYILQELNSELGYIKFQWWNGIPFEFSYGAGKTWFNPACSSFKYPVNAEKGKQHLMVIPGTKKTCPMAEINDCYVKSIRYLGNDKFRVYINFDKLPIRDYQKLFAKGMDITKKLDWSFFAVTDSFPCYYFEFTWPKGTGIFGFSFGVTKHDGIEEWIDPKLSTFYNTDYLAFDPDSYRK
ncbi:MAG: hypothetical protein NTZ97_00930 [Candidatus Moranbacteria bacterium]|nr:hypothetical protein [Candidatus Moranbacteria bacterium]